MTAGGVQEETGLNKKTKHCSASRSRSVSVDDREQGASQASRSLGCLRNRAKHSLLIPCPYDNSVNISAPARI